MCIIKNCNNQACSRKNNHKFLICTHEHPSCQDSGREAAAALLAALLSILYFQGADKSVSKILDLLVFAIPKI